MKSLYVGTYAGIPVKIHWTFGLMLLYVVYIAKEEGLSVAQGLWFGGYISILFLCVILHEYGHALMARRYGIRTLDILISPLGGIARLQRIPPRPLHEFAVAIAGPLVNVAIAMILSVLVLTVWGWEVVKENPTDIFQLSNPIVFINSTIILNILLFLFNLIPAFPMDGGRILRALLGLKFSRVKATLIASTIGQILAVGFILLAIHFNVITWAFIGLFVILMARSEYNSVKLEDTLKTKTANQVMNTVYTVFHVDDSMDSVIDTFNKKAEHNFLVVDNQDSIAGILSEQHIIKSISQDHSEAKVIQYTTTNYTYMLPENSLEEVFEKMNSRGLSLVIIKDGDQLQGVIDRHLMMKQLKG